MAITILRNQQQNHNQQQEHQQQYNDESRNHETSVDESVFGFNLGIDDIRCMAVTLDWWTTRTELAKQNRYNYGQNGIVANAMGIICTGTAGRQFVCHGCHDVWSRFGSVRSNQSNEFGRYSRRQNLEKSEMDEFNDMGKETSIPDAGIRRQYPYQQQLGTVGTVGGTPRTDTNNTGSRKPRSSTSSGTSSTQTTRNEPSRSRTDSKLARGGPALVIGRSGTTDTGRETSRRVLQMDTPEWMGPVGVWNEYFYAETTDLSKAIWFRRAYAFISFLNILMLTLDWNYFSAVLPTEAARKTVDPDTHTILTEIPDEYHIYCLYLWMFQTALMGFGILPRINAFGSFFWHCCFQHQNNLLWNGEDNVFRLLAFYLIFFPPNSVNVKSWPMWPFRLIQFQMCLIYFSTGGLKASGYYWRNGTALYITVQEDSLFGGYYNPEWLFGYTNPLMVLTYATLVLELGGIILVNFRETRTFALVNIFFFHLTLDVTMSLNFFHWIMIVGWCSFLILPDDIDNQWSYARIYRWMGRIFNRLLKRGTTSQKQNHPHSD